MSEDKGSKSPPPKPEGSPGATQVRMPEAPPPRPPGTPGTPLKKGIG